MKEKEKKGEIELKDVSKAFPSDDPKGKKPHCFNIATPERDYLMSTASAQETSSWIAAVQTTKKS